MASSIIELYVDVPADRQANIFGQFDEHLKLIERTLNVTMIFRDGSLKILGSQEGATQAKAIVEELNTLAGRGNTITQQNVNYALSLAMEKIGSVMEEIDKDFICNTIQGRPIKPKTLGQKDYVEQIRKKMIVFGVGPAGTGKSQIAYAVARILKLPWTTLDMSSIHDPEQLTGSSRVYANAKPGIIMEAFSMAGESNLVFIINELDKANSGKGNGNPADVLLTLLDNLGFTDNYIECRIPTVGVYPIATANDKENISAPLMSRFAVIDIPDYTIEEKKTIFSQFALPKVLKHMSMQKEECIIGEDALDAIMEKYKGTTGIRPLEQAAEHLAAHALYQIEANHVEKVEYTAAMVKELLDIE